jgi:hypothetical protein
MKIKLSVAACLLTLFFCFTSSWGFEKNATLQTVATQNSAGQSPLIIGIDRLNDVMGKTVRNQQGEKLGSVEGILGEGGSINYVILSRTDPSKVKNLIPIPCKAVRAQIREDVIIVDMDKEKLRTAPNFERDNQPDFSQPEWNRKVHAYYGGESGYEDQAQGFYLLLR